MNSIPPEIELEEVPCPLGCRPADEPVLVGGDRLHGLPGQFQVVRCRNCGLLRTDPRPTQETMGYYYPDEYGPFMGTRVSAADPTRVALPAWKRMILPVFRWHTESLPPLPPGRLLEIGCASGAFLHRMAGLGWAVQGAEPSEAAAGAARALGFDVFTGPIERFPEHAPRFDLIAGWMVLEHLHEPVQALRKLSRLAKPDAVLAVSVPNAGSLEFRIFGKYWYALQLPTHLYHFTPRTLGLVLEKSGWRIQKVFHQRVLSNLVASTGALLREKGCGHRFTGRLLEYPEQRGNAHYLAYPVAYLMSLLGQTGRMTVWATRMPEPGDD